MKILYKFPLILLILLIALFAFPGAALAQTQPGNGNDQVVFGGTYTLNAGQTLPGNLVVFGGVATLEKGSVVNADVALTGGSLNVSGEIKGSITAVGGSINLSDSAIVDGDINTVGGTLNRSTLAIVRGNISSSGPGNIRLPMNWNFNGIRSIADNIFNPIRDILSGILTSILMAALALLVVLFITNPTRRVSNAIVSQPLMAGGLGLLTVVVAPALILLLTITILLIPVALVGILLLALAFLFGWIAVGLEVGDRLAGLFKMQWAPPVSAALGMLVIMLASTVFLVVPVLNCIGWVVPAVITVLGLGGVFLTRLGTRESQPATPFRSAPGYLAVPTPAAPPVGPTPSPAAPPAEPPAPDMPEPPAQPDDFLPPAS